MQTNNNFQLQQYVDVQCAIVQFNNVIFHVLWALIGWKKKPFRCLFTNIIQYSVISEAKQTYVRCWGIRERKSPIDYCCLMIIIIIISLMEWNEKCKSKNNVHLTNWPTKKSYIAALLFGGLLSLLHIIQALSLESVGACASASKYLNIDAYAFLLIEKGNVCLLVQMARPFSIIFFWT